MWNNNFKLKIKIHFFKIDNKLKEEIIQFTSSFSAYQISISTSNNIDEFVTNCSKEIYDLLLINSTEDKDLLLDFLSNSKLIVSKIIILSLEKNHIFNFIKHNIFDFISFPVTSNELLISVNRGINKTINEYNYFQHRLSEEKFQKFVPINSTKKIELIKLENILYFEADGRYTMIYLTNGVSKIASKNLGEYQKLLDPSLFCRIHHKFIINMDNLVNIIKSDGYYCEMTNNKNIPVSKRKLEDLNAVLNIGKQFV